MSCEIICCEVPEILNAVAKDGGGGDDACPLRKLFSLLEQEGDIDAHRAGYLEKARTKDVVCFDRSTKVAVACLHGGHGLYSSRVLMCRAVSSAGFGACFFVLVHFPGKFVARQQSKRKAASVSCGSCCLPLADAHSKLREASKRSRCRQPLRGRMFASVCVFIHQQQRRKQRSISVRPFATAYL